MEYYSKNRGWKVNFMGIIRFLFVIFLIISFDCKNNPDITEPSKENYGVEGIIKDTVGKSISDVQIFCLFNYSQFPVQTNLNFFKLTSPDSIINNKLYQNFPNPVLNYTYFRFALNKKSFVELTLKYKLNDSVIYKYSDTLSYGIYQHYLTFDAIHNIKNGIYVFQLKINSFDANKSEYEKEMLILNGDNKPNSTSYNNGAYFFNVAEAFIGDTVSVCDLYSPENIINYPINNEIYLLFRKEGYKSKTIELSLYPNIKLTQDVVLVKDTGQ
ncbi:MAG: hypothetical protein P8Z35_19030 [Ignavibacteriaceae bacterium]